MREYIINDGIIRYIVFGKFNDLYIVARGLHVYDLFCEVCGGIIYDVEYLHYYRTMTLSASWFMVALLYWLPQMILSHMPSFDIPFFSVV